MTDPGGRIEPERGLADEASREGDALAELVNKYQLFVLYDKFWARPWRVFDSQEALDQDDPVGQGYSAEDAINAAVAYLEDLIGGNE